MLLRLFVLYACFIVGADSFTQSTTKKIVKKVNVTSDKALPTTATSVNAAWVKEATRKYSPNSWRLLELYDQLPASISCPSIGGTHVTADKAVGTFQFLEGKTKTDLLQSMSTNVHEVAHAYYHFKALVYLSDNDRQTNLDNAEGYIYLSPVKLYFVTFPLARMIQSKSLASEIPAERRTFRYPTYITGNTSTQSHGVMGLLNEFHAYYLGALCSYDLMEAYCLAGSSEASGLMAWVQHSQSLMDAFYEMDFFIREYLLFMSRNHPKSFAQLKAYSQFWKAFSEIQKDYGDLLSRYQQRIRSQITVINKKGKQTLAIEGNMLWLDNGSGKRTGASLTLKAKKQLSDLLEGKRYNFR